MTRAGFWMILFGALAFVLPHFGVQHIVFVWLGSATTPVAIALIVVGVVLFVIGRRRSSAKKAADLRDQPPPPRA